LNSLFRKEIIDVANPNYPIGLVDQNKIEISKLHGIANSWTAISSAKNKLSKRQIRLSKNG